MSFVMIFVVLALWLLSSDRACALVNVTTIERASNVNILKSATGAVSSVTVYGGLSGASARCGINASSTSQVCNTCQTIKAPTAETIPATDPDTLLLPCNERRINPNLQLSVAFSSDATAGVAGVTTKLGDAPLPATNGGATVAKGNPITIYIAWSTICAQMASDGAAFDNAAQCLPTGGKATGSFRVGISADGSGLLSKSGDDFREISVEVRSIGTPATPSPSIATNCASAAGVWQLCYFEVGPGDEKAIARTLTGPADVTFPATDYKFVRFLYAETGFNYVTLESPHKDLPIELNDAGVFKVSPRRIDGLVNDKTYYFKTALVDIAGNIGFYSGKANDNDCASSPYPGRPCRSVTPSQVAGVLDATNCFIATAAYGTPFAGELDTLRDFRDQILERSDYGRRFIRFYYEKSPYYARMILGSPVARATVRAALIPVVWFAGMSLAYGPFKAGLAFLASLIFVAASVQLGRRTAKHVARRSLLPLLIAAMLVPMLMVGSASRADVPDDILNEAPPEPEYPYPGTAGAVDARRTPEKSSDETADALPEEPLGPTAAQETPRTRKLKPAPIVEVSPIEKSDQKYRTWQQPKAVTEDGDYIYEKLPDQQAKKYGEPKAKKFSKTRGREAPATISADGEFTYNVEESPFTGAAGFRIGFLGPPKIRNNTNGLEFKNIYGGNDIPGLLVEYEYPLTRAIGRIGIKFETGVYAAQAQGRFLKGNAPEVPEESFTFIMVPLQAMIHYRFQFADRQLVVPFVEGGASYNGIAELRDDNKAPKFGGGPTLIAGAGANILLDWMDKHAIRQLDAEYGINHVWLTGQYRQIVGLKKDVDFTSHLISAGFTVDF